MKVPRVPEIVKVNVRVVQIKSRARISQNITFRGKRKDYSHTGILTRKALHAGNFNATLRQTLHTKLAKRVSAKSLARCSLSGSSAGGSPYKIKSQLSSPRTLMSKRFAKWFPSSYNCS